MTDDNLMLDKILLSQNEEELYRTVSDAVNRPGHLRKLEKAMNETQTLLFNRFRVLNARSEDELDTALQDAVDCEHLTPLEIEKLSYAVKRAMGNMRRKPYKKTKAQRKVAAAISRRPGQYNMHPFSEWVYAVRERRYLHLYSGALVTKEVFDNWEPWSTLPRITKDAEPHKRVRASTFLRRYPLIRRVYQIIRSSATGSIILVEHLGEVYRIEDTMDATGNRGVGTLVRVET